MSRPKLLLNKETEALPKASVLGKEVGLSFKIKQAIHFGAWAPRLIGKISFLLLRANLRAHTHCSQKEWKSEKVLGREHKSCSTGAPSCLRTRLFDIPHEMFHFRYFRWQQLSRKQEDKEEEEVVSKWKRRNGEFFPCSCTLMFGHVLSFSENSTYLLGCVFKKRRRECSLHRACKYDPQTYPGCQSEACFHLGLDGTGVKPGTAASGLIKSGREVPALR